MNKYGAKKTLCDGILFDSKMEAERYVQLRFLAEQGKITNLQRQVTYELLPNQRGEDIITKRGKIKPGYVLYRAWTYTADFVYNNENGEEIIEDVKGVKPNGFSNIEKMFYYTQHKRITLVMNKNITDFKKRYLPTKKRGKKK